MLQFGKDPALVQLRREWLESKPSCGTGHQLDLIIIISSFFSQRAQRTHFNAEHGWGNWSTKLGFTVAADSSRRNKVRI